MKSFLTEAQCARTRFIKENTVDNRSTPGGTYVRAARTKFQVKRRDILTLVYTIQ